MEADEYFEGLKKAMVAGNKPQPIPDEVVWLELLKALLVAPKEIDGESYLHMADEGLKHFKERFRNDNITD